MKRLERAVTAFTLSVPMLLTLVSPCQERSANNLRLPTDSTSKPLPHKGAADNHTFEMLLKGDRRAIEGAKQRFLSVNDPARKLRIASILISRGVQDPIYFNYLTVEATNALASSVPWPTNDRVVLTDSEAGVIKALWRIGKPATTPELVVVLKDGSTDHYAVEQAIQNLKKQGYITSTTKEDGERYQPLVAVRDSDTNYLQAYSLNPLFISWCKQHPNKGCDQWYQEAVYPDPDPWYFLAAAGDHRFYDLLVHGLHSQNQGIAIWAAQGLARLQDARAVDEIASVARQQGYEANVAMGKCLLYFPDSKAQSFAAEILDDKKVGNVRIVDIARQEVERRGVRGLFPW